MATVETWKTGSSHWKRHPVRIPQSQTKFEIWILFFTSIIASHTGSNKLVYDVKFDACKLYMIV